MRFTYNNYCVIILITIVIDFQDFYGQFFKYYGSNHHRFSFMHLFLQKNRVSLCLSVFFSNLLKTVSTYNKIIFFTRSITN